MVNFGTKLQNLHELAVLEFMMFGYRERIKIYYTNDLNCAKRLKVIGNEALVLF